MNYREALLELERGSEIIRKGIIEPNVVITYRLNYITKIIDVATKTTQGLRVHKITIQQFEKEAIQNNYEFEIY